MQSVIYISSILFQNGANIGHAPFFNRKIGMYNITHKNEAINELKLFIKQKRSENSDYVKASVTVSMTIADNDSLEVIDNVFLAF